MKTLKLPVMVMKKATFNSAVESAAVAGEAMGATDALTVVAFGGAVIAAAEFSGWSINKICHHFTAKRTEKKLGKIFDNKYDTIDADDPDEDDDRREELI